MTGQAVERRTPQQELVQQVRRPDFQAQIELALPEGMPASRFVRVAATAVLENPDLVRADVDTIFNSLLKAAADGLLPDGREAALVTFGGKAVYMPMIGGYRKIAAEHGWTIRTAVVREHDEFEFALGLVPVLHHRPPRPGVDRGDMIAAYAVGVATGHPAEFEVMTGDEIEKVRQTSRAKDSGPWKDWPERMWEKTVGRRLFAKLPLGERDQERIRRLIDVDALPPGEAADLMYGPQRQVIEGSARSGVDEPADTPADEGGEAAADVATAPTGGDGPAAPEAAAPASGPEEPTFEAAVVDQSDFAPPDTAAQEIAKAAAEAGLVRFSRGAHKGMTIQQVHAELTTPDKNGVKEGEGYIRYTVRQWTTEPEKSALVAYCRAHFPDALAEGQAA